MKKLLNTLYITTQGAYLARDGETILVRVEGETRLRVPIHTLDGIVCFGVVSCSPAAMMLCAENGVLLSFLSERGRFLARVHGPVSGNVLLRREQYRSADDESRSVEVARSIIAAKLANSRLVLKRALRDHSQGINTESISQASERIKRILRDLDQVSSIEGLRGCEGEGAQAYFGVFDHLILKQKDDFRYAGRSRRPPLDNVNALLSFIYTVLVHDIQSALESVGLDPAVGFLHRDRSGRPGMALDIMEEFRAVIGDRLALSLINRQQVNGRGFITTETGAVNMNDETRKAILTAYQKRKQEDIQHPFLGEKLSVGQLPYAQALLMSRFLRGDIDGYPPFIWR